MGEKKKKTSFNNKFVKRIFFVCVEEHNLRFLTGLDFHVSQLLLGKNVP